MSKQNSSRWGIGLLGLLGVWLAGAAIASARGVFDGNHPGSMKVPLPLGLAAVVPVLGFLVWFRSSRGFREYVLSLNPTVLTAVHVWRVEGVEFLILMAMGRLPAQFALPAGLGDMAIGITALIMSPGAVAN